MSKNLTIYVFVGAILGYIVVHPTLMILGHLMLESYGYGHSIKRDIIELFYLSFSVSMLPWGIAASIFSATIAFLHGTNKQYREELEHSTKMKELFNDIITHDLLNPTGAIIHAKELLDDEDVASEKELLEIIERSAKKQMEIIELAKVLSKLQNLEELDKKSHDLGDVIDNALDDTSHLFEAQDIKVENKISEPAPILANKIIISVFHNILSNAAKYTPKKSAVSVDITNDKENWIVSVKDQGEGVPDKYKETLFDRFVRRKKEGVKGTGLGLAIARRIVEIHGGRIWVEDNPEGGSVFKVRLMKNV